MKAWSYVEDFAWEIWSYISGRFPNFQPCEQVDSKKDGIIGTHFLIRHDLVWQCMALQPCVGSKIILHSGCEEVTGVHSAFSEGERGGAMTERVGKRISKWDLKEEAQLPAEIRQDNAWPGKADESIHDKESKSGWNSTEVAGSHVPKWSDVETNNALKSRDNSRWSGREPLPGNRGACKDDNINRDCNEISGSTLAWGGNKSYSRRTSPGLDAWGKQNCGRSPKGNWSGSRSRSRSRTRSPPHDFKRETEGWNDRNRSGSGVLTRSCKDFAAGTCRRGSQCRLLHQDSQSYEDRRRPESGSAESWGINTHERRGASRYSNTEEARDYPQDKTSRASGNHYDGDWGKHMLQGNSRSTSCNDFLKGKCYRGSSCKYVHHDTSADGHGVGSTKEMTREREHYHSDKNTSFEHNYKYGPRRSGNIPCKFFAVGNCRNGENCRFSHYGPARGSPDERSRDDRCGIVNEIKLYGNPKWSDATTVLDVVKSPGWSDNKVGNFDVHEPRDAERFMDDRWGHNLLNENKTWGGPTWSDKAPERDEQEYSHCRSENNGASMGVLESGKLLDGSDIPSLGANREQYPNHIGKEQGHIPQDSQSQTLNEISLPTHQQNITQVSGQQQLITTLMQPLVSENTCVQQHPSMRGDAAAVFPYEDNNAIRNSARSHSEINFSANILPMVPVQGQMFNKNGEILGSQPLTSFNAIGQSQQLLPPNPPSGQSFGLNGKVAQITNLSASLAQIFGNGPQLPQLYATLNPPNATGWMPSLPNSAGLVGPLASDSVQLSPAMRSQKQYDLIGDSIESSKPNIGNHSPEFSSKPLEQNSTAVGNPQIPLKSFSPSPLTDVPSCGNPCKTGGSDKEHHESHKFNQLEPVSNSEAKENNDTVNEGSKKERINGHSENMDADVHVDESKKSKDAKGMRSFKFALVGFVKEILKPTWREGQMSKEAHKTIVKKVVDKVTCTIQEAHIPQTQEKIDQYLSYSKPKLTKLVQAYAEKYLKS
ncbi:hypothetical protein HHK36_030495 [Tetracentron sinense]|uniref:C3H1-type domain-containing protein n=1 Tax=Tetracentron sinense TaxID=13715 RepID=A0A835CYB9_TETSI|nr:hypothetical protein HHK36_030495 [Tetracentron sinense]